MFSTETYLKRRKILVEELANKGILLLFGNIEVPRNYKSNPFRFRQDSNFLYYIGIDQPNMAATIDTTSGEVVLYGVDLTAEDTIWIGDQPKLSEWAAKSGIDKVRDINTLSYHLQRAKNLKYLPPYPADRRNYLAKLYFKTAPEVENDYSIEFIQAVVKQRSIKSDEEVAQIEDSLNRATSKLHIEAMKMSLPGEYEYRIAGAIESIMLKNLCTPAYNTICSVRGEILHNLNSHNQLQKGQLLLVDAGAENEMHYASDITRTTPVGGRFSQQQKEIYQIVLEAQNKSIQGLKPGITYKSLHLNAAKIIAQGLIDLGLISGGVEDVVQAGAHALFFPHGLGHMIGLDVHDMEDLGEDNVGYNQNIVRSEQFGTAYLRLGRELLPGFVVTVEPGIYFIPQLIQKWRHERRFVKMINYTKLEDYMNFGGIRIEDNILITKENYRILGAPIPKGIDEIEGQF